ncbi:MAG: hypothetical protein KatS3mg104_0162 [Phycisphaerae bacterium]|nr:MAG: hypothetical protein KatS3mg104_0162 [Phycisphaerae bacterium]
MIYCRGGSSSDKIYGGPGIDTMNGSTGDDKFSAEDGSVDVIDGGSGTNTFFLLSSGDYDVDRTSEGDSVNDLVTNMS